MARKQWYVDLFYNLFYDLFHYRKWNINYLYYLDTQEHPTEEHVVRLLTYLPGDILYNVTYTKELFFQVGEIVAKTNLALMVRMF